MRQADLCGFSALARCLCSLCEEQGRMERIARGSNKFSKFPPIIKALIKAGIQSSLGYTSNISLLSEMVCS